jgi:hypothetical protein
MAWQAKQFLDLAKAASAAASAQAGVTSSSALHRVTSFAAMRIAVAKFVA